MTDTVRIHEIGGPEVLRLEQADPGTPGPGQALVEHTASREDLLQSAGALFQVLQAHRDLEARRTTGSTILLP